VSLLQQLFGPSKEEVWRAIAAEVGGRFTPGGWLGLDRVQVQAGDWIVTLDTTQKGRVPYTRLRAPFINRDGLWFSVFPATLFSEFGKRFGVQDVEIGDPLFDRRFMVQSNDPERVRALLQNPRIRAAILAQKQVLFGTLPDEGAFGPRFPDGVNELEFLHGGLVKDHDQLRALFDLFAETLHFLGHLDSAYQEDPALHVETLTGPGGIIRGDGAVLWDGDAARHRAALQLGRLGVREALPHLIAALADPSPRIAVAAAWSLGAIGAPEAVYPLIARLGDFRSLGDVTVAAAAATSLRQLGWDAAPARFDAALQGDAATLAGFSDEERPWFTAALTAALASDQPAVVANAAASLAGLGVVEALEAVRAASRRPANHEIAPQLDAAVSALQERTRLPRSAEPPRPRAEGLPLAAEPAAPDSAALPRVLTRSDGS
jgi:hypothetical protein